MSGKTVGIYLNTFSQFKRKKGKTKGQEAPLRAFAKGLQERHGYKVKLLHTVEDTDIDIALMFNYWSSNKPNHSRELVWRHCKKNNIPLFVEDAGVFTSFMADNKERAKARILESWQFHRLGLNSCLGTGLYFNKNSDDKQFKFLQSQFDNLKIDNWKKDGKEILIIAQNPIGFQYQGSLSYNSWLIDTIDKIKLITDRPIKVRLHPRSVWNESKQDRKLVTFKEDERVKLSHLQGRFNFFEDLDNVYCAVTHSSSAAVDSILKGVRTIITSDRCITHAGLEKVWQDNLTDIEIPVYPEREQWAYNLAYTSFTNEQFKEIVPERFLQGLNML